MRTPMSAALTLCLLITACERAPEQQVAPPDGPSSLANGTANEAPAQKSIIRPEVADAVGAPSPAQAPAKPLEATISFGESGTSLDDAARTQLDELISLPQFARGGEIILAGHSDSTGSDEDNLVMSRRRAMAVHDYLISHGVAEDRLTVIALGERRPIEPNARADGGDFPEGRRRNRRVEVTVAPSDAEPSDADETLGPTLPTP